LRSLQGWVEERVSQWREDVEAPIHLRITAVEGQLAKLNQSVAAVTLEQTRTRDYMPVLVEDLGSALRERIDECVSMVSVERQAREEREERAAAKLQEVGRRLREQMLGEREATLARLDELKQSVSAEVESRESAVSRVEKLIEETKAALEAAMEHEERERTVGEQTLAHVLADNTAALLTNAQIMARH
jgi:organic radical activating enzyme